MSILLGFTIIGLIFVAIAFLVISQGVALVRKAAARSAADSSQPQLSDARIILQHNDPLTPLGALLRPLTTIDPAFSSTEFLRWATDAFARVTTHDAATPASQLPVTASFGARLTQEALDLRSGGFENVVKDVHLAMPSIEAVRVDSQQQAIDVRISGNWVRYVAAADGSVLEGSTTSTPFVQRATFVRPAGATTGPPGHGIANEVALWPCPHCGAEVTAGIAACPYCSTQLDQAGIPWLLAMVADAPSPIASDPATHPSASATIGLVLAGSLPGDHAATTIALGKDLHAAVEQIRRHDANFTLERFMRWATQTYLSERLRQKPLPLAIQKADFIGVITSDEGENIIVIFSSLGPGGKKLTEGAVFSRPLGSVTPPPPIAPPDTLCSGCGAPLTAGDSACRFCGAPIPDVQGAWKLEKITDKGTHLA